LPPRARIFVLRAFVRTIDITNAENRKQESDEKNGRGFALGADKVEKKMQIRHFVRDDNVVYRRDESCLCFWRIGNESN
jgi:hypothetical protein